MMIGAIVGGVVSTDSQANACSHSRWWWASSSTFFGINGPQKKDRRRRCQWRHLLLRRQSRFSIALQLLPFI